MSNPPNRIGGIRGPNGATLDDVVSVLGDISAQLGLLLGATPLPASWPGLPRALGGWADAEQTSLLGWQQLIYARLAVVLDKLGPIEGAAYLASILASLEDDVAPGIASISSGVGTVAGALPPIATLLGEIADNTLRSAECCEGGGGPGGGGTPPANECPSEYEPQLPCGQITGWLQGPIVTNAGDEVRIYYPVWTADSIVEGGDFRLYNIQYTHGDGFPYRSIFVDAGAQADVIVRWDFTGGIIPIGIGSAVDTQPFDDSIAYLNGESPIDRGDETRGAQIIFADAPFPDAQRWQMHFVFPKNTDGSWPTAAQLGLNVWQGAEMANEPPG